MEWLDLGQVGSEYFINLKQLKKEKPIDRMYCRQCCKVVRAFKPRQLKDFIIPVWFKPTTFCSKCGWCYRRKPLSMILRKQVNELDRNECVYCGATRQGKGNYLHTDHIKPVIMGGEDTVENVVTCCEFCNASKGTRKGKVKPKYGRFRRTHSS